MYSKLIPPDSEKEILENWLYTDKVYVSILCITYNQELYIKDALNSFLSQVTNFKFEIIIHDDCSNDQTSHILKLYQEKYPNIISIITPDINQYNKHPNLPFYNIINASNGKYAAFCEGDDYWISEEKLQLQFEIMEKNDRLSICIHDAFIESHDSNNRYKFIVNNIEQSTSSTLPFSYYSHEYTQLSPTASYFIRNNEFFKKITTDFLFAPCIDLYWEALLGANVGYGFINKKLSVYRLGAINSTYNTNNNLMKKILFKQRVIDYLDFSLTLLDERSKNVVEVKRNKMISNLIYFEAKARVKGSLYKWFMFVLKQKKITFNDLKTLRFFIRWNQKKNEI
uniref:WpaH n=1 Tax=Providencia alcalifaciens TaxID=126385 RepID=M9P101_9GAMM|nr:WpaH [Providencia alcalifaciens]